MNNTKNNLLNIVAQAFYGNRTNAQIYEKDIDRFILGYQDSNISTTEPINRTVINVPDEDGIVIVYNKYQEEYELNKKARLLKDENYNLKPLAVIPEKNIEIYSRCIVCRVNANGEFESLRNNDYNNITKYLSE